jgi:uncharacterized membrane protein YccC
MRRKYQVITAIATLVFGIVLSVAAGLLAWYGTESVLVTLIGVTVPLVFVVSAVYQIMATRLLE